MINSCQYKFLICLWLNGIKQQIKSTVSPETMDEREKLYIVVTFSSVQSLSHVRLCDPIDYSMLNFPVHHQLPELTQTRVH